MRPFDHSMVTAIYLLSLMGILLNILVLVAFCRNIFRRHLHLVNLALVNLLGSVVFTAIAFHLSFFFYRSAYQPSVCLFVVLGHDYALTATIVALVPLAVQRLLSSSTKRRWQILQTLLVHAPAALFAALRFRSYEAASRQIWDRAWCDLRVTDERMLEVSLKEKQPTSGVLGEKIKRKHGHF